MTEFIKYKAKINDKVDFCDWQENQVDVGTIKAVSDINFVVEWSNGAKDTIKHDSHLTEIIGTA